MKKPLSGRAIYGLPLRHDAQKENVPLAFKWFHKLHYCAQLDGGVRWWCVLVVCVGGVRW